MKDYQTGLASPGNPRCACRGFGCRRTLYALSDQERHRRVDERKEDR